MKDIKCIMFDCMETIVDMTELPDKKDYALWAFEGSGCEKYLGDFSRFYECYKSARRCILSSIPEYKEYDFKAQYEYILRENNIQVERQRFIVHMLLENYWKKYMKSCYIKEDVKETLIYLNNRYILGVVSNFKFPGGIEELLKCNGVYDLFNFVVTSVNEGWRKPHPHIYNAGIEKSGCSVNEILFVGDDFVNDYQQPAKLGMKSILLDTNGKGNDNCTKIDSIARLKDIL